MATNYSSHGTPVRGPHLAVGLGGVLWACVLAHAVEGTGPVDTKALVERAERLHRQAVHQHSQAPDDPTAAWQVARACFDRAEFATNHTERAAIAHEGIAVSRALVRQQPTLAPAHYYLAMNLGQLARTRLLGALPLVAEMEALFRKARDLDPDFDQAGSDRCLGLLYRDAPGWPVSVGNKSKARLHLRRAVELSPDSPENRLNLIETLIAWGEKQEAAREFSAVAALLPKARAKYTGEEWAASWADWDRRWQIVLAKLERNAPPASGTQH